MPKQRAKKYQWWKKLHDNIETEGPKFGQLPADNAEVKALAAAQMAAMEATDAAERALDGARAAEKTATRTHETVIRNLVRNWKTRPLFAASGSEGVLELKGTEGNFDPDTFKSRIKLFITGGHVKVDFIKGGCDGVAIYVRLRGQTGWTRLGIDSQSPYFDKRPPATPGVPEVREYMVVGIVNDVEVGLPSDIVSILYDAAP